MAYKDDYVRRPEDEEEGVLGSASEDALDESEDEEAAFGGGILRGLVGFIKYQFSYKEVKFRPYYFLGMMFVSGIIGAVAALAIKEIGFTLLGSFTPALAFIIGYAGGDSGQPPTEMMGPARPSVSGRARAAGQALDCPILR